jgi:hypothetical protein
MEKSTNIAFKTIYCPRCDTEYAQTERCKCVGIDISDANLGQTKKGYVVPADSVYTKEIWNAAIEAAANVSDAYAFTVADEIRKLKK